MKLYDVSPILVGVLWCSRLAGHRISTKVCMYGCNYLEDIEKCVILVVQSITRRKEDAFPDFAPTKRIIITVIEREWGYKITKGGLLKVG